VRVVGEPPMVGTNCQIRASNILILPSLEAGVGMAASVDIVRYRPILL
jgi:hypothetical protein